MNVLIERYLEECQKEMIDNVCGLVRIPSVRSEERNGCPYGAQCARALDFCMELAGRKGLLVRNYDYRCVRAELPGAGTGREILFAAHADVVPPDKRGEFPPFAGVVHDGYMIGRGAVDDKAPLIAVLYALAFFKQHSIPLRNRYALFIGSSEETGMDDVSYYLERSGQPDLALVVDDDFPVARGEPGLLRFSVTGELNPGILNLQSEKQSQCLYPENCRLTFRTPDGEVREQYFEKNARSPVVKLFQACSEQGICLFGEKSDLEILRLIYPACPFRMMEDFQGDVDIIPTDIQMTEDHRATVWFRVYFSQNTAHVHQTIKEIFQRIGLELKLDHCSDPCALTATDAVVKTLTDLYNQETGTDYPPYVIRRGITYARKFQYACGFGAGNPAEKKPFLPGFGCTHGPDEAHSIQTLIHAVRIYIKAIWALDTKLYN